MRTRAQIDALLSHAGCQVTGLGLTLSKGLVALRMHACMNKLNFLISHASWHVTSLGLTLNKELVA
jgi:hypothetical protein